MVPRVHLANTESADMYYLVRTRIPDPFFYIEADGRKMVILNAIEIGAFKEHADSSIEAVPLEPLWAEAKKMIGSESGLCKLAFSVFQTYGLLGREVSVPRTFPLDVADFLRAKGATLTAKHPFLLERARKSTEEVAYIRENLKATKVGFQFLEGILGSSEIHENALLYRGRELTGEFLKSEIEKVLFDQDMDDVEGMIISSGGQAAMPHHKGVGKIAPHTPIICDLFFRNRRDRYFGDMTRTYLKGTPTEAVSKMHAAVMRAQDAGFAKIRPGAHTKDVFAASAEAVREAGFDVGEKGYIHSLGHGLGLELHEAPNLSANSTDVLEVGNIVTVEPGIYYPEHGGVRIEDVVVVTENGYENLTDHPRDMVIP